MAVLLPPRFLIRLALALSVRSAETWGAKSIDLPESARLNGYSRSTTLPNSPTCGRLERIRTRRQRECDRQEAGTGTAIANGPARRMASRFGSTRGKTAPATGRAATATSFTCSRPAAAAIDQNRPSCNRKSIGPCRTPRLPIRTACLFRERRSRGGYRCRPFSPPTC